MLAAYDRLFGLEVEHLSVDGCLTKAPCAGQVAGPSPTDRRKQGLKRSVATETGGIPLAAVAAPANRRDDDDPVHRLGADEVVQSALVRDGFNPWGGRGEPRGADPFAHMATLGAHNSRASGRSYPQHPREPVHPTNLVSGSS